MDACVELSESGRRQRALADAQKQASRREELTRIGESRLYGPEDRRKADDRRENTRAPGRFKQAEDAAHSVMRKHERPAPHRCEGDNMHGRKSKRIHRCRRFDTRNVAVNGVGAMWLCPVHRGEEKRKYRY